MTPADWMAAVLTPGGGTHGREEADMTSFDGAGLGHRVAGGRSRGARSGALVAALASVTLLCCLFGPLAASGAAPAPTGRPAFSADALVARLALQQAELTAADGAAADFFGWSVALSGDTALVGAPLHVVAGQADAGTGQVRRREGHGDDDGRREQRQELHGEALTVCGARRGQRTRVSAGLTASAGVRARRNPSSRPPTAA